MFVRHFQQLPLNTSFFTFESELSAAMNTPGEVHSPENVKDSPMTEHVDNTEKGHVSDLNINQAQPEIYQQALARYPNDDAIDQDSEKAVRRKLDYRILPALGVCYFFYYVDKTTL